METVEDDDRLSQKPKISLPEEIIEQILSRIPVKSILRFKSVCKQWLSLTSTSSFTNLHSTVGPRTTALFFSAFDSSTGTRYFFSGARNSRARDGGSVANLMKLHNTPYSVGRSEHLNGLVCFTSVDNRRRKIYAYVLNPSTHKFFELPDPDSLRNYTYELPHMCYLFGFDESSNEHKVLYIDVELIKPTTIEVMIFSMSSYSWRKINVDLPTGMNRDRWWYGTEHSVCVNSVIHLMLRNPLEILAFDLKTDKFSIFNVPPDAVPEALVTSIYPYPRFITINGLLGIACYDRMVSGIKVDIWILQDYENRVWVRETVNFVTKFQIRNEAGRYYPIDCINTDDITFSPRVLSENLIRVTIYNIESRSYKLVELTLGHRYLDPKSVTVEQIKCYEESLSPLQN